MEPKVETPFKQLLTAVKMLTLAQKARLKKELTEPNSSSKDDNSSFIDMLLAGPVYTERQIRTIDENTKSIAKWRTKN